MATGLHSSTYGIRRVFDVALTLQTGRYAYRAVFSSEYISEAIHQTKSELGDREIKGANPAPT